jgi:hypothetical protein
MRTAEPDNDTQPDRDSTELTALCREVLEAKARLNDREGELLGHLQAIAERCRRKTALERANHARELKRIARVARNFLTASY